MLNDSQRSQIHFTTDYIHYRLSKRYCNQEEMQYFLEGGYTQTKFHRVLSKGKITR